MSDVIFEARNLTKKYKNQFALDDVSITLKNNRIYGFIGENGAGKSTLMKIMAGLIFPTSGDMTFMGETDPSAIENKRKGVGTMIEGPYIYPGYSVRQNVELQRLLVGNPDESATDRMIELVGLTDSSKKKAKKLSMGMKQRLGIAMAMVGNPRFLILDEPINGLDPKNIVTLRNMLKKIIGLNIMDTGLYLFLASMGYIRGAGAPILTDTEVINMADYINPVPSALVLTGIVVSVSVTAITLSLTVRLYSKYRTLNLDEIYAIARRTEKEEF